MSGQMRRSERRSRCASLSLELLEDRQLLSGWTLPQNSPPSLLKPTAGDTPAVTPSVTPATPVPWSSPAVADKIETGESYPSKATPPSPTGPTGSNAASQGPIALTTAETGDSYSHAAPNTMPSSTNQSATSVADYSGGSSYSAALAGSASTSSGGAAESAFSYYGQQPFYRMPPDQSGASRAGGNDMPQPISPAQLASLLADLDNPASPTRAAAGGADAANRRDVLALAVVANGIVEPRAARSSSAAILALPQAGPDALLAAPAAGLDAPLVPSVLALLPVSGQVAVGMLPVDLAALERGVEQFFGQIGDLGEHVTNLEAAQRLAPWLVAVALSTAALETARWQFWKPAPCKPVLTGRSRAAPSTHSWGLEPSPADAT